MTNLLILTIATLLATKLPGPIGVTPLVGGIRRPLGNDQFVDFHQEGALWEPLQ